MKKAAVITGCITAFFLYGGLLLKLIHFPFGTVFLILGVLLLDNGFLPLQLIHNLKQKQTPVLLKVSQIWGLLAGWTLSVGALFTILSWPGAQMNLLMGCISTLLFLVLYSAGQYTNKTTENKTGRLSILTAVLFIPLFVGIICIKPLKKIQQEYNQRDRKILATLSAVNLKNNQLRRDLQAEWERTAYSDSSLKSRSRYDRFERLEKNTENLIGYIQFISSDLIAHAEMLTLKDADTVQIQFIHRLTDYDTPTHYLVGSDPSNLTGRGLDLKSKIEAFRDSILIVSQFKTKPIGMETGAIADKYGIKQSWVKTNFYHSELGNTLLILKTLELKTRTTEGLVLDLLWREGN